MIAILVSSHVILNKSDTRSATGWVGLVWLVPFLGSLLYVFLGINRIEKRAKVLVAEATPYRVPLEEAPRSPADLERELGSDRARLVEHARVVETVTGWPLLVGNAVEPLIDGDKSLHQITDDICRPLEGRPTKLWYGGMAVSVFFLVVGFAAIGYGHAA